ncbi:MAG: D-tyrosyl-tRNA(Tyr) deacylase [Saprospiraceae bacterium]|nr:D-tyrosyl-tRNA(Tyr) deacylase [Saprospiraceae bacterium]
MRVVLQRVNTASVTIDDTVKAEIKAGILILVAIGIDDDEGDAEWLANKIFSLRIFNDKEGKMNLSISDIEGDFLVISQFTLLASTKKGNRPSYTKSARPEKSKPLYETFIKKLETLHNKEVLSGIFGADMKVKLLNDGPVTIIMDSKNKE